MHTPLEFYFTIPQDLYRLGRAKKAKMDYIRTTPPRPEELKWDVKLKNINGMDFVDYSSGGLSLFNYRNPSFGTLWWKVPRGTKLPTGLHVSRDDGGEPGKEHFTVRPVCDMPLVEFLAKLRELEKFAIPCFLGATNENVG